VISIRVPASTSNLGPGFDTLGLALSLYLTVEVAPCDDPHRAGSIVSVEGEGAGELPRSPDNLIHRAYRLAADREGIAPPPVVFRVRNEIPVSRGLGSSASAIVAGAAALFAASGRAVATERVLAYGAEIEGHADNVAPSLLGGFAACCTVGVETPIIVRCAWPADIRIVAVIPDTRMSTDEARAILPDSVPRVDASFNVQRAALFVAAITNGRYDAVREAMRDRLHQPYRERLLPGLAEALAIDAMPGLLGVAMSGAGSTVLALATSHVDEIGARIANCLRAHGTAATVRVLTTDESGLDVTGVLN
jgi:homoserine kinase